MRATDSLKDILPAALQDFAQKVQYTQAYQNASKWADVFGVKLPQPEVKSPIPKEDMVGTPENLQKQKEEPQPKQEVKSASTQKKYEQGVSDLLPQEAQAQAKEQSIEIPDKSGKGKFKVPSDISKMVRNAFHEFAPDALSVLYHPLDSGTYGENPQFKTGLEADATNKDGSVDRGLFRINSNTFDDFMRRKPEQLKELGITSWDDMLNPQKNAYMARLVFDEGGWKRWFAAPLAMRKKEE